jgi:FixJ family two-component response regulator
MADSDLVHVVDDDVDVRKSLGFLLATADFAVRLHESATAFLSTATGRLDGCIVTDVRMPGIDGIEVAGRLGRTHPHTVVVLISIDEMADLPPAGHLGAGVPFVRKQDFGPRLLRRLWAEYGT